MKLNNHQRDIIKEIIKGNVFDIPSYLECFQRAHLQKYDMNELKSRFETSENGREYKVMKEGHSICSTESNPVTIAGISTSLPSFFPRAKQQISDDEWEYKKAVFVEKMPKEEFLYQGTQFQFDFWSEGVFVAENYQDIIDFITLWAYLKSQLLVLEVPKPVKDAEISVFFELIERDKNKQKEEEGQEWYKTSSGLMAINPAENDLSRVLTGLATSDEFKSEPPKKLASQYLSSEWKINEEHVKVCEEYIGKKILPTTDLRVYATHLFKTTEELNRTTNTLIAVVALLISIFSFAWSLLQKQSSYTSELDNVSAQLKDIQIQVSSMERNSNTITSRTQEIQNDIDELKGNLQNDLEDINRVFRDVKQLLSDHFTESSEE